MTTTDVQPATAARSPFDLDGRVALVTGATRGIGLAAARGLAAAGAHVAIAARTAEDCEAVAGELADEGHDALPVTGNVGRPGDNDRMVADVMSRWGRLDVLVNNAGAAARFGTLADADADAFDRTFAVNVRGPIQLAGAAVKAWMGEHGGSIVNIVSALGLKAEPFIGLYSASKAAAISATRTLARELGPHGIRVNAIAPGVIDTQFSSLIVQTPALHDRAVAATCLGRLGRPDEVTGAIVWLASDAASYVTGSVVVLDGGTLA